ncbi:hypothetical protein GCM10010404_53910 [Nonomuraea africana]|uniref:Uncharacterized protein n=1 Tax=Nonomuraea africana TaxID=46171 RepID=A0ABR9K5N1_9ACTN|nr:hypothetical protein [Nonomuraea africana]MBE1557319.1 hypothetical protein [Nonomuraea africana]
MSMRKLLFLAVAATFSMGAFSSPASADRGRPVELPKEVYGGAWSAGHVQGIALDERKGFMYFSFTNLLVKTDLQGNPVGSVTGFTGHLGDLDFNAKDGRVYGSLEYKAQESFYIAVFDVDRITSMGMDAQSSDVVKTVYLKEVVDDYVADMNGDGRFDGNVANTPDHRYGCSGIDGVSFGPEFGKKNGKQKLTVAYGVYFNVSRQDNDHQVLLQYDIEQWKKYERPLTESAPHTSGPEAVDGKYFVYTGNTRYGVQNLEYDSHTGNWMMGVYRGAKPQFPNHSFYMIDGSVPARQAAIVDQPEPEEGQLLSLAPGGIEHAASGVRGWEFGAEYGLISLGDGRFYVSKAGQVTENGVTKQTSHAQLHRWTGQAPTPFEKVS